MKKDAGEILLDGLVHATAWAEEGGNDELGEFLGALYQVAGQVVLIGESEHPHPCSEYVVDVMNKRDQEEG